MADKDKKDGFWTKAAWVVGGGLAVFIGTYYLRRTLDKKTARQAEIDELERKINAIP